MLFGNVQQVHHQGEKMGKYDYTEINILLIIAGVVMIVCGIFIVLVAFGVIK